MLNERGLEPGTNVLPARWSSKSAASSAWESDSHSDESAPGGARPERDSDEKTHQELETEFTRVLEMCFEVDITADKPDEKRCTSGRVAKEISRLLGVWDKATREESKRNPFRFIQMRLEAAKVTLPQEALDESDKIALESVHGSKADDDEKDEPAWTLDMSVIPYAYAGCIVHKKVCQRD